MTTATAINGVRPDLISSTTSPLKNSMRRWTAGLFVSALFGTVSGLSGLAIAFLATGSLISPSTNIYTVGTLLIGASFILFGLAAHCLDQVDVANKAVRLEYCRQNGLKDETFEVRKVK